jgi:two-component system phosphate regulon response regulator OmpR
MAHHQRWDPLDRSIDIRIARLRKEIEPDPARPFMIRTVRGEGYILDPAGDR